MLIKIQDHIISSLNFIQIIDDWFIVANVTTLKFPTKTLKINTLMVLRVGVGKIRVCANSYFWEEWTEVFWNLNLLANHTKSENKYKLKRLNLSFNGLFFQPYLQGFANPKLTTLTMQGLFANKWALLTQIHFTTSTKSITNKSVWLACIDF
jgi:hypothetical protein